jgi:hypothetical protein
MYFEATAADIKAAQNSLHACMEALINAPFKTKEKQLSMRPHLRLLTIYQHWR